MELERRQGRVILVNSGVYMHLVLAHVVIALQFSLPLAASLRRAEHSSAFCSRPLQRSHSRFPRALLQLAEIH